MTLFMLVCQATPWIKVLPTDRFANRVTDNNVYILYMSHIVEINMFFICRSSLIGWMLRHLPFSGSFANAWMAIYVFVFFSSLRDDKLILTDQFKTLGWI